MGPGECKLVLWMGLIGMWACGYVIETRPQRSPASATLRRPYPVRAHHLRCLCNTFGVTSVPARKRPCADFGRGIAARDSPSIQSDSERLRASLLSQCHARPRRQTPRLQLADERAGGRAESRRCREKKLKLQGLCPRSCQWQTRQPQRDSLQWSELDRRKYTTRLCNSFAPGQD